MSGGPGRPISAATLDRATLLFKRLNALIM
jgi:hypothetical protein